VCRKSLPCVVCSTSSLPVWRAKAWKSRTDPASVDITRSSLAADHVRQGLLGLEDGQRAVQAAGVEILGHVHGGGFYGRGGGSSMN
jgi:hypothetical protein